MLLFLAPGSEGLSRFWRFPSFSVRESHLQVQTFASEFSRSFVAWLPVHVLYLIWMNSRRPTAALGQPDLDPIAFLDGAPREFVVARHAPGIYSI